MALITTLIKIRRRKKMTKAIDEAKRLRELGLIRKEAFDYMVEARDLLITKVANIFESNPILQALVTSGVATAMLGGAAGARMLFERQKLAKSKKNMYIADPSLLDVPAQDVDRAFDLLSHFAPSVAKNPISAANFVKSLSLMPTLGDPATVQNLVNIEKGHGSPFDAGFQEELGKGLSRNIHDVSRAVAGRKIDRD